MKREDEDRSFGVRATHHHATLDPSELGIIERA